MKQPPPTVPLIKVSAQSVDPERKSLDDTEQAKAHERRIIREKKSQSMKYAIGGFLLFDTFLAGILLERFVLAPPISNQDKKPEVIVRYVPALRPNDMSQENEMLEDEITPIEDSHDDKILAAISYFDERRKSSQSVINQTQESVNYAAGLGLETAEDLSVSVAGLPSQVADLASTSNFEDLLPNRGVRFPGDRNSSSGYSRNRGTQKQESANWAYLSKTEQRYVDQAAYIYEDLGKPQSEHYRLFSELLDTYSDPKILDKENWPLLLADKSYNNLSLSKRYNKGVPPNGFTFQERRYSASDAGSASSAQKSRAINTAVRLKPMYQQTKGRLLQTAK